MLFQEAESSFTNVPSTLFQMVQGIFLIIPNVENDCKS